MNGPEPQPATLELIALAVATRPDWRERDVKAALLACRNAGWSWGRTMTTTVRLLADPKGTPFDLKRASADPTRRGRIPTEVAVRGAELARERLAARHG